jgi:hypothetical protein
MMFPTHQNISAFASAAQVSAFVVALFAFRILSFLRGGFLMTTSTTVSALFSSPTFPYLISAP